MASRKYAYQNVFKSLIIIFFLLIAILAVFFLVRYSLGPRICINGVCLKVEIAKNDAERSRGLMFRTALGRDRGMVFIFSHDDYWGFWMKNTLIPLDIIWLDKNGKIVDMVDNARPYPGENPPTFRPVYPARFVLEANNGFIKESGASIGSFAQCIGFSSGKELK